MKKYFALLLFGYFSIQQVSAQADPAAITRIVEEGKSHNQIMSHLGYLTHRIGHRLTGSPQLDHAYEWTQVMFKKWGCENVHLDPWGEFPMVFDRGSTQIGRLLPEGAGTDSMGFSEQPRNFEFTTQSWTYGTNGLERGPAIAMPADEAEFKKIKAKLRGAWVIMPKPLARRAANSDLDNEVTNSGILGRVYGSTNELVITSGTYNRPLAEVPKDLKIIVRKSDLAAINERIDRHRDAVLEFQMDNKLTAGPKTTYNVVAEIRGTEKPDEVVIVSGHLDSWDGPGSQGAQDNGVGTVVALEAARILTAAHAKPKRTIRFILWTGEEEGLLGSRAYVKAHADEMSKISCVLVDDGGTNYEGGVACTDDMAPMMAEALKPAMDAFPKMPMTIKSVPKIPKGGGSDHASFNAVGVPGFFWFETGRNNYGYVHHTQHDRYETCIPEYLIQSATNSAAAAYVLACAPLLPREKPEPGTSQTK